MLAKRNKDRQEEDSRKFFPKDLTFEFMVSSCNPEIAKRFVGPWIPILRKMLNLYSSEKKTKAEVILNRALLYSSAVDSKPLFVIYKL
jgi:hypothetical protein